MASRERNVETTLEWVSDREADGTALVGFGETGAFGRALLTLLALRPEEVTEAYPRQEGGYCLFRLPRHWVRVVPGRGQRGKPVPPPFVRPPANVTPEVGIAWGWEGAEDPKLAEAYVTDPAFARRLAKLGIAPFRQDADGTAHYQFPAGWVKVRPPRTLSESERRQRELARQKALRSPKVAGAPNRPRSALPPRRSGLPPQGATAPGASVADATASSGARLLLPSPGPALQTGGRP